ncbi:hypothetical protein E4K67_22570 [Desulfosporosinus fructosivorans]|uniref:Uncharacterized protein n=1 Tax=Desulfosporosinus fructosivorans TaxID=2018669 RepID=A0A4Z0QZM0_9FIRM|nr:hypothetical protein [Desulfosporosinus fructosivorans]TGE35904.1 hypothetical protein E4K67_22570 [Desulfosporosinus fructosivorans]
MNYLKKGLLIILVAFVFNVLETWFFGWNLRAQSAAEGFADMIAGLGILVGMAFILGHVIGSLVNLNIELRGSLKKLVALLKISWYFNQSEKALKECVKALKREDFDEADRLERIYLEFEKKAEACNWTKVLGEGVGGECFEKPLHRTLAKR